VDTWLFNDVPTGVVADGTPTTSVNGNVAVIRGGDVNSVATSGAGFHGGGGRGIDLPGGVSGTAGYIDLPNGIVSARTDMTVNVWLRVDSINAWDRVFDFGSTDTGVGTQGGELFGPGGGGRGQEYIILSAHRGGDANTQRMDAYTDTIGRNTTDTNSVYALGQEHLFTFVWDDVGGGNSTQSWYLNGTLQSTSVAFAMQLNQINDVNNWLGRSNWVNDNNIDGTYDQFEMYDTAFTGGEVAASFAAGPIPEPTVSLVLAGSLLGLLIRRRRA
jgi:hypothetical protein